MFERYTEKARRVIFFARYEASQYGSPRIETEHLLLGLLREGHATIEALIPNLASGTEIRVEIEKHAVRGERISTSVEMPLAGEAKRALKFAAEEADRLGHRHVGTEHLLLGLLRAERGLAATALRAKNVNVETMRQSLAETQSKIHSTGETFRSTAAARASAAATASLVLEAFLGELRGGLGDNAEEFFVPQAQYIDAFGKRWCGEYELKNKMRELFAPFAARSASYRVEEVTEFRKGLCVATLVWEGVPLAGIDPGTLLRMSIAFDPQDYDWVIYFVQVTPVEGEGRHPGDAAESC
jgi:hypothetical protein